MANVSNGLTEKMKAFCRAYYANNGNATQAYLTAYNSDNPVNASIEGSKLLKRDDIQEYLHTLNKPLEKKAQNEREKKRQWLWDMINNPSVSESDRLRAMDILNKMDSEYININRNIDESESVISDIDSKTLLKLVK